MPLEIGEIQPGILAYFILSTLANDDQVIGHDYLGKNQTEFRPFICIKVDGDRSVWLAFTTVPKTGAEQLGGNKFDRIEVTGCIERSYGTLRDGRNFVQDYRHPISGPNDSFVQAAVNENPFYAGRPSLQSEKLAEVLRLVGNNGKANDANN